MTTKPGQSPSTTQSTAEIWLKLMILTGSAKRRSGRVVSAAERIRTNARVGPSFCLSSPLFPGTGSVAPFWGRLGAKMHAGERDRRSEEFGTRLQKVQA